ncbi:hypothetical protein C8R44DRAFT_856722 [Mycena epipterygia]|nr:hypothetical protein C8R44DRAFT_856722 [Mycena epipterygia]
MRLTTLHKVQGAGCPETCRSIRMVLISSPPTYFRLSLKGTLPGFGKKVVFTSYLGRALLRQSKHSLSVFPDVERGTNQHCSPRYEPEGTPLWIMQMVHHSQAAGPLFEASGPPSFRLSIPVKLSIPDGQVNHARGIGSAIFQAFHTHTSQWIVGFGTQIEKVMCRLLQRPENRMVTRPINHMTRDPRLTRESIRRVPTQARQAAGSTDSLRKDKIVLCRKMCCPLSASAVASPTPRLHDNTSRGLHFMSLNLNITVILWATRYVGMGQECGDTSPFALPMEVSVIAILECDALYRQQRGISSSSPSLIPKSNPACALDLLPLRLLPVLDGSGAGGILYRWGPAACYTESLSVPRIGCPRFFVHPQFIFLPSIPSSCLAAESVGLTWVLFTQSAPECSKSLSNSSKVLHSAPKYLKVAESVPKQPKITLKHFGRLLSATFGYFRLFFVHFRRVPIALALWLFWVTLEHFGGLESSPERTWFC